jgi:hypothetical protein
MTVMAFAAQQPLEVTNAKLTQTILADQMIGIDWTTANRSGKTISSMEMTIYFHSGTDANSRLYQTELTVRGPIAPGVTFRMNTPLGVRLDACTQLEIAEITLLYEDGTHEKIAYHKMSDPIPARSTADSAIGTVDEEENEETEEPASLTADLSWLEAERMWDQAVSRVRSTLPEASAVKFLPMGDKTMLIYRKPNGQYSFSGKVDLQQGMRQVRKSWVVSGEKQGSGSEVQFQILSALLFD